MRRVILAVMMIVVASGFLTAEALAKAVSRKIEAISIHVKETAGIRRNGYPAHAAVPLPKGAIADATHARLMLNGKEVPGQYAASAKWPDGSVQTLDVDFNASVAPGEDVMFQLEYGPEVKADATARGLAVTETADAIQVAAVKFNKSGVPLLASVAYRQEDIGPGPNGFAITDASGASFDLSQAADVRAEVLKRGPLFVVIRYTGQIKMAGDARVPFTILVEMPNSKTWWKATASFDDAANRVKTITFNSPLTLGAYPWVWDFGTGSWSYGSFRNKTDSAVLKQGPGKWEIATGAKGQEQPYETSGGRRPAVAEGWGHIQDAKEAIAFAIDDFDKVRGTTTVSLDGEGHLTIQLAPAASSTRPKLGIYQHFVATPVPIGAVTSPVSMLSPLMVTIAKSGK